MLTADISFILIMEDVMMKYTLYREGNLYKGNLHLHTNVSDGELSPESAKELYKNNGYNFLAITDHNFYGVYSELNDEDFLIIPGIEIDSVPEGNVHHVVGISTPDKTKLSHGFIYDKLSRLEASPQELVDFLVKNGNYAIYAHPFWSYTAPEELLELENILGMEVMNYSCEQESKRGNSDFYFERLCCKNKNLWGFGSDDAHGHVRDYCGSYITVKSKAFNHNSIIDAIKDGSFYASYINHGDNAPEIYDFYVEDGVAKIWTSPCKDIYINGSRKIYFPSHAGKCTHITYAEAKLPEEANYVRAICVDNSGNTSWSQPIKLK